MKSITMFKSAIVAGILATSVVANADLLSTYQNNLDVFSFSGNTLTNTGPNLPKVDLTAGNMFSLTFAYLKLSPVAIPAAAPGLVAGGGGLLEFFKDAAGTVPFYSVSFADSVFGFQGSALTSFATGAGSVVIKDAAGNPIVPPAILGFTGEYVDQSFGFSFSGARSSSYQLFADAEYTPNQVVPEPFSMSLLACGAAAFVRRKLKK